MRNRFPGSTYPQSMNRAKSIFIGVYPPVAYGILGYAIWRMVVTDPVAWLGPVLVNAPFGLLLAQAMILKNFARTKAVLPGASAVVLIGLALSAYGTLSQGLLPLGLAAIGVVGFFAYNLWYSKLDRSGDTLLAEGSPLPPVALKTLKGEVFRLRDLQQPALIFFFRGNWCPLCMAQIKEVAARYREISELGARVVLISPQSDKHSAALAKRFDVTFEFLVDEGNQAARELGLESKNGLPMGMGVLGYDDDTVLPTVIVVDAEGVVRWLDRTDNYRIRPEPETFLPLLRELCAA